MFLLDKWVLGNHVLAHTCQKGVKRGSKRVILGVKRVKKGPKNHACFLCHGYCHRLMLLFRFWTLFWGTCVKKGVFRGVHFRGHFGTPPNRGYLAIDRVSVILGVKKDPKKGSQKGSFRGKTVKVRFYVFFTTDRFWASLGSDRGVGFGPILDPDLSTNSRCFLPKV